MVPRPPHPTPRSGNRRRCRHTPWARALLLLASLAPAAPAAALDALQVQVASISGAGWTARDVEVTVRPAADGNWAVEAKLARLILPPPIGVQQRVTVTCGHMQWEGSQVVCTHGRMQALIAQLGEQNLSVRFRYHLGSNELNVTATGLAMAGGRARITARSSQQGWKAQIHGENLDLRQAPGLLDAWQAWPEGYTAQGRLSVDAAAYGGARGLRELRVQGSLSELGFSSSDGLNAAELLDIELKSRWTRERGRWNGGFETRAANGTLCLTTCWTLPEQPLIAKGEGYYAPDQQRVQVDELHLEQTGVVSGRAQAWVALGPAPKLERLSLRLDTSPLKAIYDTYLQPWLIGTTLAQLDTGGHVRGALEYDPDGPTSIQLGIHGGAIDDRNGRFGVHDLNAQLNWDDSSVARSSHIQWAGGHVYELDIGAAEANVHASERELFLPQPISIPVLDGSLDVSRLQLRRSQDGALSWQFDGVLTPVSMESFSQAMDWPVMSGKLSGMIPDVRYADQRLTVGGVLLVRAFDGSMTVRNLELERLFGVAPVVRADVELKELALEPLTRTFSFGTIQGRLGGRIRDLVMVNWRPVAFDAVLETPEDDDSRHRISQRAVDNLTSLGGGGVGGALSRSFLSVFEQFSYQRLGIRCRLSNGICDMGGVAPAPNGYYIVKGGGLPRINVVGYSDRVDWDVLVQRLEAITATEGPVVR